MPDLPTFDVASQSVYDRVLNSFGGEAAYLQWLKRAIRDEVASKAARSVIQNAQVEADQRASEARAALDAEFIASR